MAAELGLLSLNQLEKLAQSQQSQLISSGPPTNLSSSSSSSAGGGSTTWMWNPKAPLQQQQQEDQDDSWEVRAFAEDTGNIMGTTWPPRSYTCTFCRREFRSAQALGGHMNVHRRDRARLHQTQPPSSIISPTSTSPTATSTSSALLIPTQEFVTNGGGLCLLYQLPNPNGGVFTTTSQPPLDSPSTLLSISPYPPSNTLMAAPPISFPATPPPALNINHSSPSSSSSLCYSSRAEVAVLPSSRTTSPDNNKNNNDSCKETSMEELDLELRLGHRPPQS